MSFKVFKIDKRNVNYMFSNNETVHAQKYRDDGKNIESECGSIRERKHANTPTYGSVNNVTCLDCIEILIGKGFIFDEVIDQYNPEKLCKKCIDKEPVILRRGIAINVEVVEAHKDYIEQQALKIEKLEKQNAELKHRFEEANRRLANWCKNPTQCRDDHLFYPDESKKDLRPVPGGWKKGE